MTDKLCKLCGKPVHPKERKGEYCSWVCARQGQAETQLGSGVAMVWIAMSFDILGFGFWIINLGLMLFGGVVFLLGVLYLGLKVKHRYVIIKKRILLSVLTFVGSAGFWFFIRFYLMPSFRHPERIYIFALIFFLGAFLSLIVFVVGGFFIIIEKLLVPRGSIPEIRE